MHKINRKFQRVSQSLSEAQLRQLSDDEALISATDLLGKKGRDALYFLDYYSREGLELALRKYGIYKVLENLGYHNIELIVDTADPYFHRLALLSHENDGEEYLLAETVVRRQELKLNPRFETPLQKHAFEVLYIEWLTLRHPRGKFTDRRPQLPGQEYPGPGGGRTAIELLSIACRRLRLAGIINVPEYFHNAQIYSRLFTYLDPVGEGKRRAIVRDLLRNHTLSEVSWGIDLGCVLENGNAFKWFTHPQIMPFDEELSRYIQCEGYQKIVRDAEKAYSYELDRDCLRKKTSKS